MPPCGRHWNVRATRPASPTNRRGAKRLGVLLRLFAHSPFLFAQFRCELSAEVFFLEDLADLDLRIVVVRVRASLHPLDGFVHRLDFPDPEARDELLGLHERSVVDT